MSHVSVQISIKPEIGFVMETVIVSAAVLIDNTLYVTVMRAVYVLSLYGYVLSEKMYFLLQFNENTYSRDYKKIFTHSNAHNCVSV